jgi:hypothetical protein
VPETVPGSSSGESELSIAISALTSLGIGITDLVESLTGAVASSVQVETERLHAASQAKKRFWIQMAVMAGIIIVSFLVGLVLVMGQARINAEAAERADLGSVSAAVSRNRLQCIASLQSNWDVKIGIVVASGQTANRDPVAYAKALDEFRIALDLMSDYKQICYDPPNPNPNPVPL